MAMKFLTFFIIIIFLNSCGLNQGINKNPSKQNPKKHLKFKESWPIMLDNSIPQG